jgi:hypothetical protein
LARSVENLTGPTGGFDFGASRGSKGSSLNGELCFQFTVAKNLEGTLRAGDNAIFDKRVEIDGAARP